MEIIRDQAPEKLKKLEFFDILVQDTERLNRVIENYLNLAKKKKKRITDYEAGEQLKHILLLFEPQCRKKDVALTVELAEVPLYVRGDPDEFWQVLLNILLNALQASKEKGKIYLGARAEEGYIAIRVRDEGDGIPGDKLENIFKPFFTTREEGTGLGLAIVKRIADDNGWTLKITSEADKGTEFTVLIPVTNDGVTNENTAH